MPRSLVSHRTTRKVPCRLRRRLPPSCLDHSILGLRDHRASRDSRSLTTSQITVEDVGLGIGRQDQNRAHVIAPVVRFITCNSRKVGAWALCFKLVDPDLTREISRSDLDSLNTSTIKRA